MAISDKDIFDWFLSNPGADDATIAATMDQFKLSPADIARATGTDLSSVQSRYEAVAPPAPVYTPVAPTPVYEPAYEPVYETPAPVYTPPATNAYFQANPDVAGAYAANSYGMSADDFANFHYNNYGKNEGRYSPSGEPPPRAVVETPAVVEQPPAVVEQTPVDTVAENYWKEQAALQQAEWERQAAEQQREWERQAASTPVVTEPTPIPQTPVTTPSVIDEITAGPPTTEKEFLEIVSTPPAITPVTSTPETPTNQYTKENWPTINYGTYGTEGDVLTRTTTSDGTPFYLRDEEGGGQYQNPATMESYAPFTGADGKTYYNVYAPTFGSGKAWNETPITSVLTEAQYKALKGGDSAIGNLINSPVGSFALNALGPVGQVINAVNQASQGNELGAILSGLNAAGGLGVTDIGGIDIKTAQNVARGLNAIDKKDLMGAFTAGSNLLGGIPGEYATATNLASAGLALKNNDAAGFASAMGDLTKNPDLKIAAAAVKLLDAVNADTINPSALQAAITGLNSAVTKSNTATTTTPTDTTQSTTVGDFEDTEVTRLKALGYTKEQIQEYFNRLDNLTDVLDTPPSTATDTATAGTTPTDTGGDVVKDLTNAGLTQTDLSYLPTDDDFVPTIKKDEELVVTGDKPLDYLPTDNDFVPTKIDDKGEVVITGGRPTDTVTGSTGADTITGATGNDNVETVTVTGGTGNDTITGGDGNDSVTGGTGNDSITGGTGNDDVEELVVTNKKECAPGFHDDGTGLCVPDDDIKDPDECPDGYIRNLETGACEKVEVTTPVVNPPVVVQPPVVQPPVVKPPVVIPTQSFTPSTSTYTSAEETNPIYAGAMDDFNLFATLEELLAEKSDTTDKKKDNKKSKDKTKMATGGHLDDLLAEQMTVDDLLKLLR